MFSYYVIGTSLLLVFLLKFEGQSTRHHQVVSALIFAAVPIVLSISTTGQPPGSWLALLVPVAAYLMYIRTLHYFDRDPRTDHREFATAFKEAMARPDPVGRKAVTPDYLLFLRIVACTLVVVMHSGIVFRHDFTFGHSALAFVLYSPAWLGMIIFFTLSGYLMGKGFKSGKYETDRNGVQRYLRNRFLRIYPLMFTVGVLAIVLQSPTLLTQPQLVVRIMTFNFNGDGGTDSIGAFWSLTTEWQFYLLVPILFVLFSFIFQFRSSLGAITFLVLVAGFLTRLYMWKHHGGFAGWNNYVYPTLIDNMDVFLIGFLANWWIQRLENFGEVLRRSWFFLLFAIYVAYSYIAYPPMAGVNSDNAAVFGVLLPGLTAFAMLFVIIGCEAQTKREKTRSKSRQTVGKALELGGNLVYPIYLTHSAIFFGVQSGIPAAPYPFRLLISVIVILLVSWILHETVESRMSQLRQRLDSGKRIFPQSSQHIEGIVN